MKTVRTIESVTLQRIPGRNTLVGIELDRGWWVDPVSDRGRHTAADPGTVGVTLRWVQNLSGGVRLRQTLVSIGGGDQTELQWVQN